MESWDFGKKVGEFNLESSGKTERAWTKAVLPGERSWSKQKDPGHMVEDRYVQAWGKPETEDAEQKGQRETDTCSPSVPLQ